MATKLQNKNNKEEYDVIVRHEQNIDESTETELIINASNCWLSFNLKQAKNLQRQITLAITKMENCPIN